MKIWRINITIIFIIFTLTVKSQSLCDTLPFIQCQENNICVSNDENINSLIQKFKILDSNNENRIQIVHIGDSHLQAGFLTEKIKQNLFQYYSKAETTVSPGFIFPYTIAHTNNPFFYKVHYSGNWDCCKNVDSKKSCSLGLSGITVRTNDSIASLSITMLNNKSDYGKKYFFNTIKIFHNTDSAIQIKLNNEKIISKKGFSQINLENLTDSFSININIKDSNTFFELYGIVLENTTSKINYHTIGVNGATAQSYLKCNYFSNQLASINPDLIILSLGTNEAYNEDFTSLKHEYILKDLILQIRDILPKTAIILTTPNDHLKNRKNSNPNITKVRNNIFKISTDFQLSVWDFYSIMGGEYSIHKWYEKGLTGLDRLHFNHKGYEIQGELFVKAFIDLIENNELK